MNEPFDPYVEWLGFPPGRPPGNHYEILGIAPQESDPEAIARAADNLRGQIRKIRPGQHLAQWQQLLDQLHEAKTCLLDPGRKQAYDAALRGERPASPSPGGPEAGQGPPRQAPADPPMAVPPTLATPPAPASAPLGPAAPPGPGPDAPTSMPPANPAFGAVPPQALPPGAFPPSPPPGAMPPGPAPTYSQTPPGYAPPPDAAPLAPPDWNSSSPAPMPHGGAVPPGYTEPYPGHAYGAPPPAPPPHAQWSAAPAGPAADYIPPQPPADFRSPAPPSAVPMPAASEPSPRDYGGGDEGAAVVTSARPAPRRRTSPALLLVIVLLVAAVGGLGYLIRDALHRSREVAASNGSKESTGQQPADPNGSGPNGDATGKSAANGEKPPVKPGPASDPDPKTASDPTEKPGPKGKAEKPADPGPGAKTKPDQPEPTQPPVPKIDAAKQAALREALEQARAGLRQHDLDWAAQHLEIAATNVQTSEDEADLERAKAMRHYLAEFWSGVRKSVASLGAAEELIVGDTRVAVVEADEHKLIIKAAGKNRRYDIEKIPPVLVMPLAARWFNQGPASKAAIAAYLAVDPKGDPDRARQLFQEAARAGLDTAGLIEEIRAVRNAAAEGRTADPATPAARRVPPPRDQGALAQAERLVRDAYQRDYERAQSAIDMFQLARRLLDDVRRTDESAEARYVMLQEARRLATAAGKATTACEAIDVTAEYFEIDPLARKVEALREVADACRTLLSHKETAQVAMAVGQEALDRKQPQAARQMAELALECAQRSQSASMVREANALKQRLADAP